ncbi:MAG TPA: gamma-glutamylcyclotransferase [Rhizobiales bacterium]|nr:gamma-glutamylcyclotransferase [Hyphomicrobiales bacterium]
MDFSHLPLTPEGDLWVFAYGSLMWAPDFDPAACLSVQVHGWRRAFSLRSTSAWGSEEKPGLCASLHAGGSVAGRALRVRAGQLENVLRDLAQREAAYLPRRLKARARGRPPFPMLGFVHDYDHPRSAAGLGLAEQARLIAQGRGSRGTSLFYLRQTLEELAKDGRTDRQAARLLELVLSI